MKKIWISLAAIALAWAAGSAWAGADLAAAEKKVNELCGTCHGKDGNTPNTPDTPKLAGQPADYLSKALHAYKSGKRKNPIMGGMAGTLSDDEIEGLAQYFSHQKGDLYTKY
ncbi:MAG TPA: cytochrome c [Burkholderiales bacterium]|nr:cytochrome c [Burkholderiales bacterium]